MDEVPSEGCNYRGLVESIMVGVFEGDEISTGGSSIERTIRQEEERRFRKVQI